MTFRPLNQNEIQALRKIGRKYELKDPSIANYPFAYLEVSYEFLQGGFCVCIIIQREMTKHRNVSSRHIKAIYRGASRRSYKDTHNDTKGEMQAFCRALRCSRGVEV